MTSFFSHGMPLNNRVYLKTRQNYPTINFKAGPPRRGGNIWDQWNCNCYKPPMPRFAAFGFTLGIIDAVIRGIQTLTLSRQMRNYNNYAANFGNYNQGWNFQNLAGVNQYAQSNGYQQTITVAGRRYGFQEVGKDGTAIYKSLDGKGDIYKLEKVNTEPTQNQDE